MAKKIKKKAKKRPVRKRAVRRKKAVRPKKRPSARKKSRPKAGKKVAKKRLPKLPDEPMGRVTHYFSKAKAAAVMIERDTIRVGDVLFIKGHTTGFKQPVQSLQINRQGVTQATAGEEVGIGVRSKVREHDLVYKLG